MKFKALSRLYLSTAGAQGQQGKESNININSHIESKFYLISI